MWIKRIIAFVLCAVCLCTCLAVPASAENVTASSLVNIISPLYDIAKNVSSELTIVGTSAECTSQADGKDTVQITVKQTLQKYSGWFWIWDNVKDASWTSTVNGSYIFLTNTKSGLSSGKYRVESEFTLTDKDGKSETITIYSDEKAV